MAGRAELREFQSSLLFSKLANELQLQMVFFTGPCQHASHTARSRNCCFLQNEFSIYKICSDSGVHYVLACFAPAHASLATPGKPPPPLLSHPGLDQLMKLQESAWGALSLTTGIGDENTVNSFPCWISHSVSSAVLFWL